MYNITCGTPYNEQPPLLNLYGSQANIILDLGRITPYLQINIPSYLHDLIDISIYLYCIDSQISIQNTQPCKCNITIPVRDTCTWHNSLVVYKLINLLNTLSPHHYNLTFTQLSQIDNIHVTKEHLPNSLLHSTNVCVFGSGIDSLAGILYDLKYDLGSYTLLGFYGSDKEIAIQRKLFAGIKQTHNTVNYLPIKITSQYVPCGFEGNLRALLFSSIGLSISYLLGERELTIYENGVCNLNLSNYYRNAFTLPSLTNPIFIEKFQDLFATLTNAKFNIRSPFHWYTKQELLETISQEPHKELINETSSCSKLSLLPENKTHCGECKKCLERRLAILGSKLHKYDSPKNYLHDIFLDNWHDLKDIYDAKDFFKMASDIYHMNFNHFLREYPQVYDLTSCLSDDKPAKSVFFFLKRHATNIHNVLVRTIKKYADRIFEGRLPSKSVLFLLTNKYSYMTSPLQNSKILEQHINDMPTQYCEFAIDRDHKAVVVSGGVTLVGTEYRLVLLLLPFFLDAKNNCCCCQPVKASDLASEIYQGDEVNLRKLVSRINKKIAHEIAMRMDLDIGPSGFIENIRGHGYRINPSVKLLATYGQLMNKELTST